MDPLAPLISALHSEGRLRVWSLVITIFGDLVQHRGGEISTVRLRALLGRVGVEQGALRTALSRLGGDGWVTRERHGRTSRYRLSPQGMNRFGPATTRIYAAPRSGPVDGWAAVLSVGENGAQEFRICPADEAPEHADCMVVGDLAQVSAAYRDAMLSDEHRDALAALASDISALQNEIAEPLDAAAARMLLIHRWRRVVLRFPGIAAELMPKNAPLGDPRGSVAQAYAALTPAAEAWLSTTYDDMRPLPKVTNAAGKRFGKSLQA